MTLSRSSVAGALMGLAVTMPGMALAQETGTIEGQVTDAATARPLASAQVFIADTRIGAVTNAGGRFVLPNVPAGTQQLTVALLGYASATGSVQVVADQTATLDFELSTTAISLDEVVVTAVGEQRRVELGNAVTALNPTEITETAPVTNMADLIQGRSAGVQVFNSSGTPGMGSRIRIRGANSMSLSNEPLVYVDGIRVETGSDFAMNVGGQEPSRFDDLNPEDIESIEIVRGPAAATLYGTEAANGVVRITTKRGVVGDTRWNVWLESGLTQEPNDYPLNYLGLAADDGVCRLNNVAAEACVQDRVSSYQIMNDEEFTPKADAFRNQVGLSVSGGTGQVDYYISGERTTDVAPWKLPDRDRQDLIERNVRINNDVERPQNLERASLRANVNARLSERASIALRTGYVHSSLSFTNNDNSSFGFLPSAYFGGAIPEEGWEGGWGFQRPAQLFGRDRFQNIDRFLSSATLQWETLDWLSARLTGGVDYVKQSDISWIPRGLGVPGTANLGAKNANSTDIYHYTVDGVVTANFALAPAITSRTSVGVQYLRELVHQTEAQGQDLPPGAGSIGVAALTEADELHQESKTAGIFVEQQIGWNDRVFLTAALRADDNSAFGRDFEAIYYPKASVSWLISDEPFFPELGLLDEFRIRAAAGRSGLQPGSTAALRTLNSSAITSPEDETTVGVRVDEIGNTLLEPEQTSEIEAGFDADLFGGRAGVEVTYYHKRSDAALVDAPLPPSVGTDPSRWINIGEVRNSGWEVGLEATVLDRDAVRVDLFLSGSVNENELLTLGEDAEPVGNLNRHTPGYTLGGWWERPILDYEDANDDGILVPDEIQLGDTAVFIGPSMPERQLSAGLNLTLFENLGLYALFDHRGDYYAYNNTEKFRCDFQLCGALNDPTTPLDEQARAVASRYHTAPTVYGYIEKADFWKLREVSLTYQVPSSWVERMGANRATLTFSGRNLATWTDYSGMDPEINSGGASEDFGISEFLTQPPVRYWTLRMSLGF